MKFPQAKNTKKERKKDKSFKKNFHKFKVLGKFVWKKTTYCDNVTQY
jgi:hypothetical protein